MKKPAALLALALACGSCAAPGGAVAPRMTHGPMLGRPGSRQIGLWVRTDRPGVARLSLRAEGAAPVDVPIRTRLESDNTGWTVVKGLRPDTRYAVLGGPEEAGFRTLPDPALLKDPKHNPRGLFNFSFEFACGNNQGRHSLGPELRTLGTILGRRGKLPDFAILNGDWLYEDRRDHPVEAWLRDAGLTADRAPRTVALAPTITAVWENYKVYLERSRWLREWHRRVPSYFTLDDHEIVNDVVGCGTPGFRDRRAVFRDIAVRAWMDYLGWSNPIDFTQDARFGRARLKAGSDLLEDPGADFTKLDRSQAATLHVHWGTPTAGVDDSALDGAGGDPNAGVYAVEEVLGPRRLRIRPPARADGEAVYSIGRRTYYRFRVANAEYFCLDTRSHREKHDAKRPMNPEVSMLGDLQRRWLMESMKASDADFLFVVSSVNFSIPHVGAGGMNVAAADKDDAWTAFLYEREKLITFFEGLGRPVFILTGDLHNSFVVRISDRVWEFASGPHNSRNHPASSEGGRPPSGPFDSRGRKVDIRWSTWFHDDSPRDLRIQPVYCIVQVNNVFENPVGEGGRVKIAYPRPQVVFQYHDGRTGALLYAEAVSAVR